MDNFNDMSQKNELIKKYKLIAPHIKNYYVFASPHKESICRCLPTKTMIMYWHTHINHLYVNAALHTSRINIYS